VEVLVVEVEILLGYQEVLVVEVGEQLRLQVEQVILLLQIPLKEMLVVRVLEVLLIMVLVVEVEQPQLVVMVHQQ
tara:strand:+ start:162 stop:386 length:225 start_codon:yes stop_codon:yes gene_type:complete